MNQETIDALDRIHRGNKIILREIARVCKKNNITFFLESGTLLGAVRHKSAIPWDDDADIAMLRSDFEKFRRVARKELKPEFLYVEPDELGGAVFDFVPRVLLMDSAIRPDSEEERFYGGGIYNHLATDIFIIDDVSDSDWIHNLCHGLLIICYGLGLGHRYRLDWSKYKGASRFVIKVLAAVGKHISAKRIVRLYDRISRLETGKNKKRGRCYYGNYLFGDIGQIYQKEWFAPPVEVVLDEDVFPGPRNWHKCLETLYGNYMELPPEEKRCQPHMKPEYVVIRHPDMEDAPR